MEHNITKTSETYLKAIQQDQQTDILFECFAALLIAAEDLGPNDIHVIPIENAKRAFKNDIIPAKMEDAYDASNYFYQNEEGIFRIFTSRAAILDYLPEDLYAPVDNTDELYDELGNRRTKEEIEKYRIKTNEQLKSAVRFFSPLEVEINKFRIHRELNELKNLESFDRLLSTLWSDYAIKNSRWKRFVRTLHLIKHIIGDPPKTKALIEYVLGSSVDLVFTIDECFTHVETGQDILLGENMSLGNTIYDYLEICTLLIENLSTKSFFAYFDHRSADGLLLKTIIDHYFPLNVEVRLDFSIKVLAAKPGVSQEVPVLGFSSTLGN